MIDDLFNQMIDIEGIQYMIDKPDYVFQHCKNKWETIDGTKIYPKDMTTLHIENSIKMVERICKNEGWNPTDYIIYNKLVKELKGRKE